MMGARLHIVDAANNMTHIVRKSQIEIGHLAWCGVRPAPDSLIHLLPDCRAHQSSQQ